MRVILIDYEQSRQIGRWCCASWKREFTGLAATYV